ncbi:hypothetical protein [Aporhodopirellula aestuarii]|uniref:Uncharacterized protein n=1 Tax=Aporhodopirellula aestuarii TaxID=2950107 RepID=A0ABT0UAS4_9BACT|nr:hypothetical protein [Aporhodopirellula aestuarii]MCM2374113.1 hypothetical protein [Aporhodopirellula aestuarii]
MKVASQRGYDTTVAARIAGEDITRGDFVTVFHEMVELPSFMWSCSPISLAPDEPVQFRYMPSNAGVPLKVLEVCLPFVYVKNCRGDVVTIDTRRRQLVLLDHRCGKKVWKKLKPTKRRGK